MTETTDTDAPEAQSPAQQPEKDPNPVIEPPESEPAGPTADAEAIGPNSTDLTRIDLDEDRQVILVGTAHISAHSVRLVEQVIEAEQPDTICVELDAKRLKTLKNEDTWKDLDLIELIREGKLTFLLARLLLTAFQNQMGGYTGVKPGQEMMTAVTLAESSGAELILADRDVQITLLRAWRNTPWWRRFEIISVILVSFFQKGEVDEDSLSELRQQSNISQILDELGETLPELKTALVDERDQFMAESIKHAPGRKIVAVVGAAHVPGIRKNIGDDSHSESSREDLTHIPPKSAFSKSLPWLIPAIVLGLFGWGLFQGDYAQLKNAAYAWVLANGIFSALATIFARAHPLTVLTAFAAAPITSLNPTIGAGMATAFVQTVLVPPQVQDFESVRDDVTSFRGWWSNKLARIALVFFFSSIGSTVGTFLAFGWLKNLI